MRKLLSSFALTAMFYSAAIVQAETREETLSRAMNGDKTAICEIWRANAKDIFLERQAGLSKEAAMAAVTGRKMGDIFTRAAFSIPIIKDQADMKRKAERFGNEFKKVCIKNIALNEVGK